MTEDTPDLTPEPLGIRPPVPDIALWERFLAGESTEAEEERMRGWGAPSQSTSGHTAGTVRDAAMAALGGPEDPPTIDALRMLRVLEERLAIDPRQPGRDRSVAVANQGARRAIASLICAAAAAVILIVAAPAGRPVIRSIHVGPRDTGTFQTGPGERLHLRFSDGTVVSAAPATSVRVVGPGDHRDIYVRGEAYFDASDARAASLVVHAANAVLENAGGHFVIRTDSDAHEVRIAVAAGVVLVGDSQAPWRAGRLLTRGTFGAVTAQGATRAFRASDPAAAAAWEAGAPRFGRERLRDALPVGGRAT